MIDFEEAYQIIMQQAIYLPPEHCELKNALHRVLAQDIFSDTDMPPFDKSAMDGYACKRTDLFNDLEVVEVIPAGKMPKHEIGTNQCAKIMTGAPLPKGAELVIMIEDTTVLPNGNIRYVKGTQNPESCVAEWGLKIGTNVCKTGEDMRKGEIVLKKGTYLKAQHVAVLASAGATRVMVSRRASVGVIATGSELVEPDRVPENSQIRNSNGSQLTAQLAQANHSGTYYGIAEDSPEGLHRLLSKALAENDIVLISGGVSEGDFDFVPQVIRNLGFEIKFDRIAVQPGKPTTFAVKGNRYIFGMPGNPVSSFVQFELLVKPFLLALQGAQSHPVSLKLPLGVDFSRKKAKRMSWIPVNISREGKVLPVEYHGSAHINGLCAADAIMAVPVGVTQIKEGEPADVRPI